jgi:hypothetical protein
MWTSPRATEKCIVLLSAPKVKVYLFRVDNDLLNKKLLGLWKDDPADHGH